LAEPDGLVRLAAELGISERVTFLPPQSRENLAALFRAADLVAVPSYSESFGLVALEAQACGTPVVAAAVGGLPVAVQDGVTGRLVDGHGIEAWASALDELLRLGSGPRGWATRRAAAAHAAKFSWERTVDAQLASYTQAIDDFAAARSGRMRVLGSARRSRRWPARRGARA
jgi:D-inositol-3-phosphate glycosyltransferase